MSSEEKKYLYNDEIGYIQLIDHLGSDTRIVNAARASYGKEIESIKDKDIQLIQYLITNKHTSPLEHCVVTFRLCVPIFVARQHMRHRTWSYSEKSMRFTSEDIQFYEISNFRKQDLVNKQGSIEEETFNPIDPPYSRLPASRLIEYHHDNALKLYHELISMGIARELARGILPFNLYTTYYATANLNNIFKFIDLRDEAHAQYEIQLVAQEMKNFLFDLFPLTAKIYYGQ